ncbi:permease prefix domain 1-containing protein [Planococcus sp. APC 4015]|nr:permease prefix domain 1-containing protein [Planococcus sp. APC 4015]
MTTTATLTERYVDAATRTVPEAQRADLAAELRASIDDQIDAKTDGGMPHAEAERVVLTELGDPDKLAAGYTDRQLFVVGPRYYLAWWRLLKLLLAIVPACAVFGVALGQTLAGESFGTIIGAVWPVLLSVIVHVCFWTTLVFWIVERSARGSDAGFVGEWTLDQLPESKDRGAGLTNLICSIVFLALAAGAILWDQLIGFVFTADAGGGLPFLAPSLWPWWIAGLLALMVVEALLEIAVYASGRWQFGTATVNVVLNVAVALPAVWLLTRGELINPEFFPAVIPTDSAATVATVVSALTGFGVVAIAAWDSIDGFRKARRAR